MNCPECGTLMSGGGDSGHPDYTYFWCNSCKEQFEYTRDARYADTSDWELTEKVGV